MHTLILNASPRPDGTIARMMGLAREIAGDSAIFVDVCRLNIRPCTACMACARRDAAACPGTTPTGSPSNCPARAVSRLERLIVRAGKRSGAPS